MNLEPNFETIEEGDANFYMIANDKNWLFRIQVNGELISEKQKSILNLLVSCLNFSIAVEQEITKKLNDTTRND